ncbi:Uncharacterised protein [Chlamydia abortus]|nr:Uncharacterised protein [Chlamydia abortus]
MFLTAGLIKLSNSSLAIVFLLSTKYLSLIFLIIAFQLESNFFIIKKFFKTLLFVFDLNPSIL